MALATRPRLLLLDEPVAGMGLEETQRMVRLLSTLKRRVTIVLVEHDMDAVFTLADRISVMVYGRIIATRSEEHTSELQSLAYLVCRLLLEKKKKKKLHMLATISHVARHYVN